MFWSVLTRPDNHARQLGYVVKANFSNSVAGLTIPFKCSSLFFANCASGGRGSNNLRAHLDF